MNVKCLQLEFWMTALEDDDLLGYTPVEPVFNRDGYYRLGDKCWFEVDGKAYAGDRLLESHKYQMSILDVSRYNSKQIDALRKVIEQRVATKAQREAYQLYAYYLEHRDVERSVARCWLRLGLEEN